VDYAGFARDRARLDRVLAGVAEAKEPDLALLLNAYNATVVASVLRHDRPARVTDVKGFFDGERHRIAREKLTLNELETRIRRRYHDPRIHFALNCAARSCPPLWGRAFEAPTLERTLDTLTRTFLDGSGVKVEPGGKVAVSKLFEWYGEDFAAAGGPGGSIEKFLLRWLTDPARRAAVAGGGTIAFQEYDWSLNAR
jgi:hypothetical protein